MKTKICAFNFNVNDLPTGHKKSELESIFFRDVFVTKNEVFGIFRNFQSGYFRPGKIYL